MSNLREKASFPPTPYCFIAWKASKAKRSLSVMSHLGTKALWLIDMILLRMPFSLLAIVLEMILYTTLQQLIGLKLATDRGSEHLDIKEM